MCVFVRATLVQQSKAKKRKSSVLELLPVAARPWIHNSGSFPLMLPSGVLILFLHNTRNSNWFKPVWDIPSPLCGIVAKRRGERREKKEKKKEEEREKKKRGGKREEKKMEELRYMMHVEAEAPPRFLHLGLRPRRSAQTSPIQTAASLNNAVSLSGTGQCYFQVTVDHKRSSMSRSGKLSRGLAWCLERTNISGAKLSGLGQAHAALPVL